MRSVPGTHMKRWERKSCVAEKRKFAALAELHRQDDVVETDPSVVTETPATPSSEVATLGTGPGRGRPATGKRSNPDWKLYSHFLKRKTQRAVVAHLQAEDSGRDLSDILEELLENWLKS